MAKETEKRSVKRSLEITGIHTWVAISPAFSGLTLVGVAYIKRFCEKSERETAITDPFISFQCQIAPDGEVAVDLGQRNKPNLVFYQGNIYLGDNQPHPRTFAQAGFYLFPAPIPRMSRYSDLKLP